MAFTETPPPLPPPGVVLIDAKGRPTQAFFDYLVKLLAYLKRMGAAIP
jgi:hypothetical protein